MSDADLTQSPSTDPTETTDTTATEPAEQAPVAPAEGTEAVKEDEFAPLEGEATPAPEGAEPAPMGDDAAAAPEPAPEAEGEAEASAPLDSATGVEDESTSDFSEATGAPDAQPASFEAADEAAEPAVAPEAEPVAEPAEDAAAPADEPAEAKDDAAADELPAAHWDVTTPDAALPIQVTNDDTKVDFAEEDHGNLGAGATPEATQPTTVTAADSEDKDEASEDEPAAEASLKGPIDEARPDVEADAEKTEASDEPNAALQSPLEAIRSQTHKDADPVLEEQESPTDVAIRRPLAAQVIEETKGAFDAVPEEAQQQMAKDRHTFADPNAMAGTIEDPTGVSGDVNSAQLQTAIAGGKQPSDAIKDQASGTGDDTSAAGALLTDEGEGEGEADDADSITAEAGDDDTFSADIDADEGYFGELRPEFAPMADIVDDGLDKIKEAAEAGAKAVNVLIAIPLSVLELEHRSIVERLQRINGELMLLAGELFKKK